MKGLKNLIKAIGVISVLSIAVWLVINAYWLLTPGKRQIEERDKQRRVAMNRVAMELPSEYKLAILLTHGKEPSALLVTEFKALLDNLVEKCDQPTSRERIAYIITEVHSICKVVVPEQEVARNPLDVGLGLGRTMALMRERNVYHVPIRIEEAAVLYVASLPGTQAREQANELGKKLGLQ